MKAEEKGALKNVSCIERPGSDAWFASRIFAAASLARRMTPARETRSRPSGRHSRIASPRPLADCSTASAPADVIRGSSYLWGAITTFVIVTKHSEAGGQKRQVSTDISCRKVCTNIDRPGKCGVVTMVPLLYNADLSCTLRSADGSVSR